MNLRYLGYLVALAQERNFHDAGRVPHIAQPTLSSALYQLEAELGVPLAQAPGPRRRSAAARRPPAAAASRASGTPSDKLTAELISNRCMMYC